MITNRTLHFLLLFTLTACLLAPAEAVTFRSEDDDKSKLLREPGATYVEDLFPEKSPEIELLVLEPVVAYGDTKAQRRLGTFDRNKVVDLVAVSEFAYKVRGEARNGRLAGWVSKKSLSSKDPELGKKLKSVIERYEMVEELIANKQVAIGMTPEEVSRVLGTPTRRESRVTANGQSDVWEFITYETINHYDYVRDPATGQTYKRFSHAEKIEKGKVRIEFEDGTAAAISESEEDTGRGGLKIIPVPLIWE